MEKKYLAWGGVLLAIVLLLGVFFPRPGPSVIERVVEKLGGFSGPVIDSPFLSVNGIEHLYDRQAFSTASTTLCFFRPNATSTLLRAFANVKTATGTAIVVDFGKSTNPSATTTNLGSAFALAANLKANIFYFASSTNVISSDVTSENVFGPNDYFVVKFGGGSGPATGVHAIGGNCQAEFIVH